MVMNKDILTVKDLNKYLPALKTEVDIHFQDKLKEGLFKVDALLGLKKVPSESIDLIVTEPALDPNSGLSYSAYINWIEEWVAECKRVLTTSGSIYIICPWESSSLYHSVLGKNFIIQSRITAERQIENTELSQWKNKISDIWFATKTNDYIFNQNYIVNGKNINVSNCKLYDFAAYQKKSFFSYGYLKVDNIYSCKKPLAQIGSSVIIDGKNVEQTNFDTKDLYDGDI